MDRRTLIQLSLSFILLVGLLVLYGAWYEQVHKANLLAGKLRAEIEQKTQDTQHIAKARAALDTLRTNEATVHGYFVATPDVVTFLGQLQAQGESLGSTVSILNVSSDDKTPRGTLTLALKVSGPFSSVLRTLGSIEYSAHDVRLSDLTLDTPVTELANATSSSATWTAAVIFTVGTLAPTIATTTTP